MAQTLLGNEFQLQESSREFDHKELLALFLGQSACYIVRGFASPRECEAIWRKFQTFHTHDRSDRVPGFRIGAFHYGKTTGEYFREVADTTIDLQSLLGGSSDPMEEVHRHLAASLGTSEIDYRAANFCGQEAAKFVARSWTDKGKYALAVHEDIAQLKHPAQRDFEIQSVASRTVVGVNLCIKSSLSGGALLLWNLKPDDADRVQNGVEYTGYPYPQCVLGDRKPLRVLPQQGDLYFVNGSLLHAVEQTGDGDTRLTLSFLSGMKDEKTTIYWT